MTADTKKLHLIEELLKIEGDTILTEVEMVLTKAKSKLPRSKGFQDFSGILSLEEVNELERNIEEGCEQMNENDRK